MKKRLLSLTIALIMCLSLLPASVFASDSGVVPINQNTFPDPTFRDFVKTLPGGSDNQFTADELAAIKKISFDAYRLPEVSNVKGIEYFTSLEELAINYSSITELDVSKNTSLRYLNCTFNKLNSLTLGQNSVMNNLRCSNNQLTTLDFEGTPSIKWLSCSGNKLTTLDLALPELYSLDCNENQLTQLDLSGCPNLTTLACFNNQLTQLELTPVPDLWSLQCAGNQLKTLNCFPVPKLAILDVRCNQLTSLDLSENPNLKTLFCSYNMLTDLDVRTHAKLEYLYCEENELASLNLSQNPNLEALKHMGNCYFVADSTSLSDLPGLDLSKVENIQGGSFDNGKINFTDDAITYDYHTGLTYSADWVNPVVSITLRRSFTDVPSGAWYTKPVRWAVNKEITSGMTKTTFGPTAPCNRAQIVTFLWKLADSPAPTTTENPFTDVPENAWFHDAVLWAVENGITKGMSDTEFGPTVTCNRAQAMTFLWKYLEEPEVDDDSKLAFTDVTEGAWYETAVRWAVENRITKGMSKTEFGSTAPCNRAQIVTFLYRTSWPGF